MKTIYLSDLTTRHALDTSVATLGAPGVPGEMRVHYHATFGTQIYWLLLNESGVAINPAALGGRGVAIAAGTAHGGRSISGLSAANTAPMAWGGVVVETAIADDEWGWVLWQGECLASVADGTVVNAELSTEATGALGSAVPATSLVVGHLLAANASGATAPRRAWIAGGAFERA